MFSAGAMFGPVQGHPCYTGKVIELGTDEGGISLQVEVFEIDQTTQWHHAADLVAVNVQCLESCHSGQGGQISDGVIGELESLDMAEGFNSQQRSDAGMATVEFSKLGGSSDGTVKHRLLDAFIEGAVLDIVVSEQRCRCIHDLLIDGELVVSTGAQKHKGGGQNDYLAHVLSLGNRRSRRTMFHTIIAVIPDNKNCELNTWNSRGQNGRDH